MLLVGDACLQDTSKTIKDVFFFGFVCQKCVLYFLG